MDRRHFFKSGLNNATKTAVQQADKAAQQRVNWIRPPFALAELDFLLACTRCHACIDACPHQVIFPLSAKLGLQTVNTPALDLTHQACLLCNDWPCVSACEPAALSPPPAAKKDDDEVPDTCPPLASAHIDTDHCIAYLGMECGACNDSCPVEGALFWVKTRPFIDLNLCVGCGQCRQACIYDPKAIKLACLR